MIIEEKVREAVELFMRNPYWQEYYETAPSEHSKRRAELAFCWSVETDESKSEEAMTEAREITPDTFGIPQDLGERLQEGPWVDEKYGGGLASDLRKIEGVR